MNRLDELIAELCPDGVEYKRIGEVCETITDYTAAGSFADIAKNVHYINSESGFAQLIRTTDLKSRFSNEDKFIYVDEHAFKYLWRVNLNKEGLVLPNVGNCGEVYYITPNVFPLCNNVLGPNAIWVRSEHALNRYLFHVFSAKEFQQKLAKIVSPTGQTKFNKTNFKELLIPVPPLPVQHEIVRILDSFTELTAELAAELAARKKQYEYFRDTLLASAGYSSNIKIGNITRVFSASRVHREDWKNEGVPFYRSSDVIAAFNGVENSRGKAFISLELYESLSAKSGKMRKDDLLITGGGTIGIPYIIPDDSPIYVKDADLICIQKNDRVLTRYLYHYFLSTSFRDYLKSITHDATIAHYTINQVQNTPIPVPRIEEQSRIISLLDRFDALCNDITKGLPAEIAARQKQYEYYRDKLLTFKPLS